MRCVTVPALTLALTACVVSACEARLPPAAATCTRPSDCVAPLYCVEGRCGSECTTARDCGADRRCVRVGAIGRCLIESIRQCDGITPCELDGLVCRAERCYNACDACTPDTRCVDGVCVLGGADAGPGPLDAPAAPDA